MTRRTPCREMEVLHEANWTRQVTDTLKKFEKQLIIALKEKGWDGKEEEDTVPHKILYFQTLHT